MRNPFRRDPDPFAASRYSDVFRGVRTRKRKHLRHRWQWVTLGVFVVLVGLAGLGFWKYKQIECRIACGGPVTPEEGEGAAFNVLLVGSDSREGLTEQEQLDLGANAIGGERADTIILAHIEPGTDEVVLVQFPRDLWVSIDGGPPNKINSALAQGPADLIRTVEDLTGLTINRYVQVNIAGFRDVVDAIGGVDICIPEPIPFDRHTGIEITPEEVGMVHFDGERAIRFVRSRNFVRGDFDRIRNQQKFLAAAVRKVTSVETLLRPGRVLELLQIAGENLRTDQNTSLTRLRRLLERFRSFDPERYEAYTAPNLGIAPEGEMSVVRPDYRTMRVMFHAIENNKSPAEADDVPNVEPSTIRVGVYNATTTPGRASQAASALKDATHVGAGPIRIVDIGNAAASRLKRTVIRYEREAEKLARLVAAAVPGAKLRRDSTPVGVDVAIDVGRRFRTKKIVQIVPIPLPKPGAVPEVCRED